MAETKGLDPRISMTSEAEVSLLKSTFKGNDYFLKVVRMFLYGISITDADTQLIKSTFSNPALHKAFRKKIYPIFEEDIPEIPVGSLADFWYGTEVMVNGRDRDTITQNIGTKVKVKKMFEYAMALLQGEVRIIDLNYDPSPELDPLGISLIARNLYIKAINEGVNIIKLICDQVEETEEQKKLRIAQNSNK